ncbi:hypothetical protein [Legionella sp. 16cNR16C]|uniref:hypothetical protein n=1 Tax=Legionella sp. 16cNR16C TaxID=2905656 RepID=UPI001E34F19E|nr:hypothetical protein [Legionella sp. 16cNR16C]MCE3043408.1 hypothetical protein [Legionella sp. 16cNR16C]
MPKHCQWILSFIFSFFITLAWAKDSDSQWYELDANNKVTIKVDLFLSSTCPHCQKEDAYFKSIEPQNKWLKVERHYIDRDKASLELFNQYLNQQDSTDFSVPAVFFCNSKWVGFNEAANSGKAIMQGLELCRQQIEKRGQLTKNTSSILGTMATTSMMEASIEQGASSSPRTLIPLMAAIDALNPCASILVMLLFAFMVASKDTYQRLTIAGLFLLTAGVVHFIQQSHILHFYSLLPWLRIPVILVGGALIGFAYYKYTNKSIEALALFGVVFFTALVAQVYQLGCSPNIGLIFKQWLGAQGYDSIKQQLLLVLYNFLYLFFLGLSTIFMYGVTRMKRALRYEQFIKYFAYSFLSLVGITLIVYPYIIASAVYMLAVVVLAVIVAQILKYYRVR